jgi:hypothetical protein
MVSFKPLFFFLLLALTGSKAFSQGITEEEFKSIIPDLNAGRYEPAFIKAKMLLATRVNDSSDLRGIVGYITLFAGAGAVSQEKMTHDDLRTWARSLVGQRLVMPAHPCVDSARNSFNALRFFTKDDGYEGMVISSNSDKTSILCFEYYAFDHPVPVRDFIGHTVRTGGWLKSVEINPNNSKVWIARLQLVSSFVRKVE